MRQRRRGSAARLAALLLAGTAGAAAADGSADGASRFAVCLVGELRTGADPEAQQRLAWALAPVAPDIFVVISRHDEIRHPSGAGGCIRGATCVSRADGGGGEDTAVHAGLYGTRRRPTSVKEMEYMRTSGPLAESIRDFVVADDDEAIRRAEALGGSGGGGDLVQLALRARGRVCLDAVERREATARSGKRYGFVMRLRPDYAFDCRLPPMGAAWAALPRAWAAHHRDYWEVMSRPAADVGFKWLWEEAAGLEMCRNKGALTEPGTRVESCLYFALCSRGVAVSAADEYITERGAKNRDKRRAVAVARSAAAKRGVPLPPLLPGIIIRPCCDAAAAHGSFFKELPTATCALERAPVLGAWFLAGFEADGTAAWRAARQRAVKLLRPACNETLADDVPPKSGDDDDDDFAAAPPPPPALVDEDDVPAWALPPARKDEGGGEDGGGDDDDDGRADADARPAADDDDDDDGARTAERSELRR